MNGTSIGLSALSAGQRAIDIIGQNIANAATPGYHRRSAALSARVYDGMNGAGVEVQRVVRHDEPMLHAALLAARSEAERFDTRLSLELQVESLLASAGIDQGLSRFFDSITRLTTRPDDPSLRRSFLTDAAGLAGSINQAAERLSTLRSQARASIDAVVADINRTASTLASLNEQIARIEAGGGQAHDLRDQRDAMLDQLAGWIDLRTIDQGSSMTVLAGGFPLVVGIAAWPIATEVDGAGHLLVRGADPSAPPLSMTGGRLSGLLEEHNRALPAYQDRLNELAVALMHRVDGVQATGLGLGGPFSALIGTRAVADASVPLGQAGLALPVQAGELFLSMTDTSTGHRTLTAIAIDPDSQSLTDIAASITAATGGHVQGVVTSEGTLNLQAAAGFTFDFAGRLPTEPDNVAMNGTSVPTVTGTYSGALNDSYSFQVIGNGTIGETPGLLLEVHNNSGTLVASLNIGEGYTAGSDLDITAGVRVALSAGTTNGGSFSTRLVADPDTAGLLPALGLNSLFAGSDAASITVNPEVLADAGRLSAGRSAALGDGRNLERLVALRDRPMLAGGTQTLNRYALETAALAGDAVRSLDLGREAAASLRDGLAQQEQAISGVDINEEMVRLLEFQRLVEAGARYLAVVNQALDAILGIVR